ncbi:DUF943 family protein [Erwinia mallotivora]|uniref:Membrane protein n=1 Tax=Erwinia mallotivora TaxID=69222 RepID=A0A014M2N5_9GAMM|nr:DUF943 family protein [Erwinia mallotivora]EXU76121.1 membrane protein [Erwinia mallotivora]
MKKLSILLVVILISGIVFFFFSERKTTSVIDVHYNGRTAQVIVDELPFTDSGKLKWWLDSEGEILQKYKIPSGDAGPFLITVYAFGDGYKEEGKEDRRCFDDITPPRNCLDKNRLMTIWRTRKGSVKYDF